ncbi:kinase-associated lipoprotein B [Paenibacillus glycanilyticus]|uniref:kinase-associated lipoprotein B n=1 Tax=Paenibacillus glycanilyticus TaxID=126569 RepID=UPI002040E1FA|nr:kinase-associated lipoprotein B [Paenibacillus glycanilyticus]MCM3629409.1 kinase-associated lipoprotein B [Paenibacillus glycanilyticus]
MQELNRDFIVPGALAKADVRSGQYIGEIVEVNGPRAVFKVLAVLKHPEQGDLHHPYNPDVAMFHERRALSYTEKTNVPLRDLKPFEGEVPDYNASLQEAVAAQIAALDRLMRWSARGLELLKELRKEYK